PHRGQPVHGDGQVLVFLRFAPQRQPDLHSVSFPCWRSSNGKSSGMTRCEVTACSTSLARRLEASLPPPPRSPTTPTRSSLSHTLSSLRLKRVSDQPRRLAASAEDGMELNPVPPRRSMGSA